MIPGARLQLGTGSGVVAAFDGVVLLVVGDAPPDRLLAVAREAAQAGGAPGRGLARRLAALLTGDEADTVPAFGALADAGDGLVVFLFGPVVATAAGDDGTELTLSGGDAATWVDRVLAPGTGPVLVAPAGAPPDVVSTAFELDSGVVPGGWLRLIPAGSAAAGEPATAPVEAAPPEAPMAEVPPAEAPPRPARPLVADPVPEHEASPPPPPPPPPPPAPETAEESEDGVEAGDTDETAVVGVAFESFELQPDRSSLREPLPIEAPADEGDEPEPEPEVDEGDLVGGILCKRGHFNSPLAGYCSSCGISMVHQTHNVVRQKRPPLGFVVFDDGSTFTLDGRYVLGREPDTDALISSGEARPIMLEDPQMSVSRVHAEIRLVEWDVELVDRGSTNGTHVWDPERGVWDRLSTGEARLVHPGTRGAVGQRTFVYESPHRR